MRSARRIEPSTLNAQLSALAWAATDGATVARRDLAHWARRPVPMLLGLLFPVMLMLMFGYLFGGALAIPGDYREYLVPGILALAVVFGVEQTMSAVATDSARGVTDRFRSMPMAPSAVVLGRCGADLLHSVAGLAVLLGAGLAIGWRPHGGVLAALAAVGLLLLLRVAMLWVGIQLGLVAKNPDAVIAVQVLVWPLGFASNAFVAPDTMPGWLGAVCEWNPLSATAAATRELFGNPGWGGDSWAAQNSLLLAVAWPLVLIAVFAPLSVRSYRRLGG